MTSDRPPAAKHLHLGDGADRSVVGREVCRGTPDVQARLGMTPDGLAAQLADIEERARTQFAKWPPGLGTPGNSWLIHAGGFSVVVGRARRGYRVIGFMPGAEVQAPIPSPADPAAEAWLAALLAPAKTMAAQERRLWVAMWRTNNWD